jgi:hypothetical protein
MTQLVHDYGPELLIRSGTAWVNQNVVRFERIAAQQGSLTVEGPMTNFYVSYPFHNPTKDIQVLQVVNSHPNQEALLSGEIRMNSNGNPSWWAGKVPWSKRGHVYRPPPSCWATGAEPK